MTTREESRQHSAVICWACAVGFSGLLLVAVCQSRTTTRDTHAATRNELTITAAELRVAQDALDEMRSRKEAFRLAYLEQVKATNVCA